MSEYIYKIYPSLGIARVGNGPLRRETVVFTPEVPWQHLYDTDVEYRVTKDELEQVIDRSAIDASVAVVNQNRPPNVEKLAELLVDGALKGLVDQRRLTRAIDDIKIASAGDGDIDCAVDDDQLCPNKVTGACLELLTSKYQGAVKKQVQRFYIYKFDRASGEPKGRVQPDELDSITWSVDVANKKAFWYDYNNALDLSLPEGNGNLAAVVSKDKLAPGLTAKRRNPNIVGADRRRQLVISSKGSVSKESRDTELSGKFPANEKKKDKRLTTQLGIEDRADVVLGHLEYDDEDGALLFYAGDGISKALTASSLNTDFADNSNWYDDICDGQVTATFRLKGESKEIALEDKENAAWIATAPPDFAPQIEPLVTMFDMVTGANYNESRLNGLRTQFSDVFPFLYRLYRMQWVNQADFADNSLNVELSSVEFEQLLDSRESAESVRKQIFSMFRNPFFEPVAGSTAGDRSGNKAGFKFAEDGSLVFLNRSIPSANKTDIRTRSSDRELKLPYYPGDGVDYPGSPMQWFAVPPYVYQHLKNWADGEFSVTNAEKKAATNIDSLAKYYQGVFKSSKNAALLSTRAVLDTLYGGGFHPGVELTWPLRRAQMYATNAYHGTVRGDVNLLGLREIRLNAAPGDEFDEIKYNDFGNTIDVQDVAQSVRGEPDAAWLWDTTPGDLTKWMGIPWQSDAASCQAVYTAEDFPIPAWWAANLPVTVIPSFRYQRFRDRFTGEKANGYSQEMVKQLGPERFEELRVEQFSARQNWLQTADTGFVGYHAEAGYTNGLVQMVDQWKEMGMVMARKVELTPTEDPGKIPEVVYVSYSGEDTEPNS